MRLAYDRSAGGPMPGFISPGAVFRGPQRVRLDALRSGYTGQQYTKWFNLRPSRLGAGTGRVSLGPKAAAPPFTHASTGCEGRTEHRTASLVSRSRFACRGAARLAASAFPPGEWHWRRQVRRKFESTGRSIPNRRRGIDNIQEWFLPCLQAANQDRNRCFLIPCTGNWRERAGVEAGLWSNALP